MGGDCSLCRPDPLRESRCFGGRLRFELPLESIREILIRPERPRPIANLVLQRHEASPARFLIRIELAGTPAECYCLLGSSRRRRSIRSRPCCTGCPSLEPRPRSRDPILELGCHVIDVKAVEEVAAVERKCFLESTLPEELVEGSRVAPKRLVRERELVA